MPGISARIPQIMQCDIAHHRDLPNIHALHDLNAE